MSSKTITMEDLVRISTFILVLVLALSSFEGAANSQETGKVILLLTIGPALALQSITRILRWCGMRGRLS